jgi:hypothetical protein
MNSMFRTGSMPQPTEEKASCGGKTTTMRDDVDRALAVVRRGTAVLLKGVFHWLHSS